MVSKIKLKNELQKMSEQNYFDRVVEAIYDTKIAIHLGITYDYKIL